MSRQGLYGNLKGAAFAGIITAVFMYFVYYAGWRSIGAGLCIGFFVYVCISAYSIFARIYLSKINLVILLLLNTIVNILIIFVIALIFVGVFYLDGRFNILFNNPSNLFNSAFIIGISFGLFLSMVFNFYSIVDNLIGSHILGKLFIGRYRNPIEVDRVFMFLDIRSSTSIAEQIGHLKFLSLVNDFFYDLTEPVRQTKGEIYKYVGDEAIITWKTKDAITNANCIRCFLKIKEVISVRAGHYKSLYGVIPDFKAGLHGGISVTGELGYTRREIAYMGDVLNTTARIEEACKTHSEPLLISENLAGQLGTYDFFKLKKVGQVRLRGKTDDMVLFGLDDSNESDIVI